MATKTRIDWVDGLKGVCGVFVTLFHYLLAFKPDGFVGWNAIPSEAEKFDYYFEYFPYSILTNGSCVLYVFFSLISFIPAYKYFVNRDRLSIQRQAKVRYFRLMPATLILCLLSLLFDEIGIFRASEVGETLGNTWMSAIICDMTLPGAIYNGLIGAFLFGTNYVTVFWCMHYIFLGSYLAYAVILLFGDMKNRTGVYLTFLVVGFFFPWTFSFIAGIAAADILVQIGDGGKNRGAVGIGLIVIGLLFFCIPPVIVPTWLSMDLIYGVGNLFFIIGIGSCKAAFPKGVQGAGKILFFDHYRTSIRSFHTIIDHVPLAARGRLNIGVERSYLYSGGYPAQRCGCLYHRKKYWCCNKPYDL